MSARSLTAEQGRQAFVDSISGSPRRKKSLCKRELSSNYKREFNASQITKNLKTDDNSILDDLPFTDIDPGNPVDVTLDSTPITNKRAFSAREDRIIVEEIERQKSQPDFVKIDYHKVALKVGTRTNTQCWQRYNKTLNAGHKKGTWAAEEDKELLALIMSNNGKLVWKRIAEKMSTRRNPKQCRERWQNHLDPTINKGPFTKEEDANLLALAEKHNKSWAKIARDMPNRTEGQVKTRYKKISDGTKYKQTKYSAKRRPQGHTAQTWIESNPVPISNPPPAATLPRDPSYTFVSQPMVSQPIRQPPPHGSLERSLSNLVINFDGQPDPSQKDAFLQRDPSFLDMYTSDNLTGIPVSQAIPVSQQENAQTKANKSLIPPFQRQVSLGWGSMLSSELPTDIGEIATPSNSNSVKAAPTRSTSSWLEGLQFLEHPAPIHNLKDTLNVPANNWNAFFNQTFFQPQ